MLEKLLSSRARIEILKLFLFNPENRYYQRQVSNLTGQSIRAVQREVKKLEDAGLIKSNEEGNRIYYKINRASPIFEELKRIFFKTVGIAEVLKRELKGVELIKVAFIYGSYAKDEEDLKSDIDLMVIGDINSRRLSSLLSKPKNELGREINYIVFDVEDFRNKVNKEDHFLNTVLNEDKIFLVGDEDELRRIIEGR
jgi:DNA-binding transcriptional ArsR family regulator